MEVVEAKRPVQTTEESVSAGGRRHTQGTYVLEEMPGNGTRISFRFEWLEAPLIERLAAPMTRAALRRANQRSMRRLAETLAAEMEPNDSSPGPR